jgi:flagellin
MALSITNNVASINAQHNLGRTNALLSKSLERLSSGLKINRGADGPAALVISEQQRAQISGLQAAIDNSSKAVALVQTGEGALNEINGLLTKIRSLAVDSSNAGVHDANSLAANQAEIANALETIDRIAGNTQFGTKKLFDGTAGFDGTTSDTDVTFLRATSAAPTGISAVVVTTAAQRASVVGGNAVGTLAADETLTVNGVAISLATGDDITAVSNKINNFTGQTGVTAEDDGAGALRLRTTTFGTAATIRVQSSVAAGANTTGIGTAEVSDAGVDVQGTIGGLSGVGSGNVLTAQGISVSFALAAGSTTTAVTGAQGNVNVVDRSLQFQIGANAGQTASVAFDKLDTGALGIGANGAGTANLGAVDVRNFAGAQDAIRVVDQAINDVSSLRGRLGAFQSNTLESNANNLRTTLENTTAAESVVRDTDFAAEIASFTKYQVQLQAGASVLGNANQITQLVAGLLRG